MVALTTALNEGKLAKLPHDLDGELIVLEHEGIAGTY